MRRFLIILSFIIFSGVSLPARDVIPRWDIGTVSADYIYDSLRVRLSLEFTDQDVPSGRAVSFTPIIREGGVDHVMHPFVIYGRRRPPEAPVTGDPKEMSVMSDDFATPVDFSCRFGDIPEERDTLDVYVSVSEWNSKGYRLQSDSRLVARLTRPPKPDISLPYDYVPEADAGSDRERMIVFTPEWKTGSSRIDMRLNGNDSLWNEARSMFADMASCRYVALRSVRVDGWSDVGGSISSNKAVSARRASEAATLLRRSKLVPNSVRISAEGRGEDWDGFVTWASSSFWGRDSMVMSILRSMPQDNAERTLKKEYPSFWQSAGLYCFPALRRIEYTVAYTPVRFQTYNDVIDAARNHPWCVASSDLMTVASSHDLDAEGMKELWMKVASANAGDYGMLCNAAIACMDAGDVKEALRFLSMCPEGYRRSDYLRAVCASLLGDWSQCLEILHGLPMGDRDYDNAKALARRMVLWQESAKNWNAAVFKIFIPMS